MSKEIDKSTRKVLTEKSKRYYFKYLEEGDEGYDGGSCLEKCMFYNKLTMIGSATCGKCVHNEECNDDEHYIVCKKIKEATKKE